MEGCHHCVSFKKHTLPSIRANKSLKESNIEIKTYYVRRPTRRDTDGYPIYISVSSKEKRLSQRFSCQLRAFPSMYFDIGAEKPLRKYDWAVKGRDLMNIINWCMKMIPTKIIPRTAGKIETRGSSFSSDLAYRSGKDLTR